MKRSLILTLVVLIWTFCSDYNPFENQTNINMVIQTEKTTLQLDTINFIYIFTSETLTVAAAVKEEIDSFTVSAEGNRYWQHLSFNAPITSENYIFLFSYPTVGQKKITLNTYRNNGDIIPLEFTLQVTSPLSQEPVIVEGGFVCSLFTDPVGDNDIMYNWRFQKQTGQPLIISYPDNVYGVQIDEVLMGTTGYLWVEDTLGNISPEVMFTYNFIDTTGPVILCVNEGINGDTVVTGASSFIFKIECNDGLGIGSALVNNTLFTDSTVNIKSTVYYKTFTGMDTLSSYLTAGVKAWDNGENENSHTFYIRYDINGPKEVIFIKFPPQNPYTTNQDSYDIIATIFNPVDDSIVVKVEHIETGSALYLDTLTGYAEEDVTYTADLQVGSNTVVIYVLELDSVTNILAKDTVSLTYTTGIIEDNTEPYINSIKVNGIEGKAHYVAGDYAYLELEAFDEHMDSVVINGSLKAEVEKYLWKDTLALNGDQQFFIIHLTDSSDNVTNDTVKVQRNYLPVIDPPVSWPQTLIIGKPWNTVFTVVDDDGDSVDVTHEPGVTGSLPDSGAITFSQLPRRRWIARWNGSLTSITNEIVNQSYETEIVLSDSKQNTIYPWNFSIKDSTQAVSYIFKMILPANVDTTEEGDLDLSTISKPVIINCLLIADAKPFTESDTIAIIQYDQTIKFSADAADTNEFSLTFNPIEKEENELMIIMVIDSTGEETVVDSVEIFYTFGFPDYIDSLDWLLRSDTGIKIDDEDKVIEWLGIYIKLLENEFTNDIYEMETMPWYIPDVVQDYPVLRFSPDEHSNLINQYETWIEGPFTLFFVAHLAHDAQNMGEHILLSTGAESYLGLGVFNGKMGITGQINSMVVDQDTTITCNLKVIKNEWHILCFSSEHGFNDDIQAFTLEMWLDNFACQDNAITIPTANMIGEFKYMILGGGGKHLGVKNWHGDMAEVIKYSQFLNDEEREDVFRYLASRYKIKIHSE